MTFKVIKFFTQKTEVDGVFTVAFNGDDRFFHKLEVHCQADLGSDVLDYVELFGMWFYIIAIEYAGQARTSKNLKLVVSRGAIKRLLRDSSSKAHLFNYTNAIRTQLFGLADIDVEKAPRWVDDLQVVACTKWDGEPPKYPEVVNPLVGPVGITYHALERYYDATNREGRADLIFQKVCRILREATCKIQLPEKVLKHKASKYGSAHGTDLYLQSPAGWQVVIVSPEGEQAILATIYMRGSF